MNDQELEFAMFEYISRQAENYCETDALLAQHQLTAAQAAQQAQTFRAAYFQDLADRKIRTQNPAALCLDLAEQLRNTPGDRVLQHLYFCTVTDTGLLCLFPEEECTEEQNIRNYLFQRERVRKLEQFLQTAAECRRALSRIQSFPEPSAASDCPEEFQLLYELTLSHTFLYGAVKNPVYRDNLHALLLLLNGSPELAALKPYLLFAMLSRKHGMMQNRPHFLPNLRTAFQYQSYQIDADNGKNFNLYQSYLELYDHLRRFYQADGITNITFCDYCFVRFSPLRTWFYRNCEPDVEIPMDLPEMVQEAAALRFPSLFRYADYSDCDLSGFGESHPALFRSWAKAVTPGRTEAFLRCIADGSDPGAILQTMPESAKFPQYAMLFLYEQAESRLGAQMMALSQNIVDADNA